jgi:hypothetical protein
MFFIEGISFFMGSFWIGNEAILRWGIRDILLGDLLCSILDLFNNEFYYLLVIFLSFKVR